MAVPERVKALQVTAAAVHRFLPQSHASVLAIDSYTFKRPERRKVASPALSRMTYRLKLRTLENVEA